MKKILVIGGGAAGFAAALTAAERGAKVEILEASEKCGRKIRLSGNGRCNLASVKSPAGAYHGSDPAFAVRLVTESMPELLAFFDSCGILLRTVGDGIYPYSEEADSVYRNLLARADALSVTVRTNQPVRRVSFENGEFAVGTDTWTYHADAVILAAGSPASDPDVPFGYDIAVSLGHSLRTPMPALVMLNGADAPYGWDGVRARGTVTITADGRKATVSSGQIQFRREGISGIPVMDVSGTAARALAEGKDVLAHLDLFPDRTIEEVRDLISRGGRASELCGILPAKLAREACRAGDMPGVLKDLVVRIASAGTFAQAQCASGGIPVSETDPNTLESLCFPGLYLCGEMLDIDGICGGFNLSFAFLTGIQAGRSAADD